MHTSTGRLYYSAQQQDHNGSFSTIATHVMRLQQLLVRKSVMEGVAYYDTTGRAVQCSSSRAGILSKNKRAGVVAVAVVPGAGSSPFACGAWEVYPPASQPASQRCNAGDPEPAGLYPKGARGVNWRPPQPVALDWIG